MHNVIGQAGTRYIPFKYIGMCPQNVIDLEFETVADLLFAYLGK